MRWSRAPLLSVGVALLGLARPAHAEDSVRACIAASTDGQTLRQQGKLLEAREQILACARDTCPSIVRSHCARWLGEIEAQIPSIVVRAQDAAGADLLDARVTIDGRPAKLDGQPVRLDPGEHVVGAETRTGARKKERVLLVAGEPSRLVTLRLPLPVAASAPVVAPPPAHHVPTGAWILGAAGVALLGGATYFGLTAASDLRDLQSSCSPNCSDAQTQPGRRNALAFDVMLGVGGAAVGAAVVWALVFSAPSEASVDVRAVAGGALTSVTVRY